MTEAEKAALLLFRELFKAQPNMFQGLHPTEGCGQQLAEFIHAFIQRYSEKAQ